MERNKTLGGKHATDYKRKVMCPMRPVRGCLPERCFLRNKARGSSNCHLSGGMLALQCLCIDMSHRRGDQPENSIAHDDPLQGEVMVEPIFLKGQREEKYY